MRATKKAERSMELLAKMLVGHGLDANVVEEIKDTAPSTVHATSMQGEAVLAFLEKPAMFTTKVCKREVCDLTFATNYRKVGYCSDHCRAKDIERQTGVKWNWLKPDIERWGGDPPLVIPPAALKKLDEYVRWFNSQPPIQSQTRNQEVEIVLPEEQDPDYLPLSMSPPPEEDTFQDIPSELPQSEPLTSLPHQPEEDPFGFE